MMTCLRCASIPQARELRRPNQGISRDPDVGGGAPDSQRAERHAPWQTLDQAVNLAFNN